jgi:hypothetical protein
VIRAVVRAGSMLGVIKISDTKTDYLVLKERRRTFRPEIPHELATPNHTVPYGTVPSGGRFSRHFVPGYDQSVPPGQMPVPIEDPATQPQALGKRPKLQGQASSLSTQGKPHARQHKEASL